MMAAYSARGWGRQAHGDSETGARRLRCDLTAPHLVVLASPPDDRLERALTAAVPGSLFDGRGDPIRGLLRIPPPGPALLVAAVRRIHSKLGRPVSIGLSNVCEGASSFAAGFEEARHALLGTSLLRGAPGVMTYEELGAYKYLLRMSIGEDMRDRHRQAVARLAEYDRQRSTFLLPTLEEFLRRHGNISATAEALFVPQNTLRQRLRRIRPNSVSSGGSRVLWVARWRGGCVDGSVRAALSGLTGRVGRAGASGGAVGGVSALSPGRRTRRRGGGGLRWRPGGVSGAGERERGVVGRGEEVQVAEAVGQVQDRLARGAGDAGGHAEQDAPQRLGVAAQRQVLILGGGA